MNTWDVSLPEWISRWYEMVEEAKAEIWNPPKGSFDQLEQDDRDVSETLAQSMDDDDISSTDEGSIIYMAGNNSEISESGNDSDTD